MEGVSLRLCSCGCIKTNRKMLCQLNKASAKERNVEDLLWQLLWRPKEHAKHTHVHLSEGESERIHVYGGE